MPSATPRKHCVVPKNDVDSSADLQDQAASMFSEKETDLNTATVPERTSTPAIPSWSASSTHTVSPTL